MSEKSDFIEINGFKHHRHEFIRRSEPEMKDRSEEFYELMDSRRSIRMFSDKPVPREVIENVLMTASSAPSGAHKQPWTFCVISDPEIKHKIRLAAEEEEQKNYESRMNDQWLKDLAPIGTDAQKPFLETVPYIIVVFKRAFEQDENGGRVKNYYVNESVGLASGFLIAALHYAGLVTLTHTPSPMGFLTDILKRPRNEVPFLLLPVGYPADDVFVPDLKRKPLEDVSVFFNSASE